MRIALINEKGGTGKTTLAVHLAAWLAERKRQRVLLVDLDPQGQVGKTLGFPPRIEHATVSDLLLNPDRKVSELIQSVPGVPGLDVLLSDKRLADTISSIDREPDSRELLRRVFTRHTQHDLVLFDSPPSLGFLTQNVLYAADRAVIPVQLTYLALDGCAEIVQTLARIREETGRPTPAIGAIVPTFFRRTRMAAEALERLRSYFPKWVTAPIGFAVAIDEAQSYGQTIWQYRPTSRAAELFSGIMRQIGRRLDLR